jgi:hypothetical protein
MPYYKLNCQPVLDGEFDGAAGASPQQARPEPAAES